MSSHRDPFAVRPETAAEVCARFPLSEAAGMLLRGQQTPQQYFVELTKARLFNDALRFAAEYLTPREAVWWGVLCLWQVFRDDVPAGEERVLRAVIEWVQQPDEEHRRTVEAAMRAADNSVIARNLALAAFCSGGSISLADQPSVAPPAGQVGSSVAAAVGMAARRVEPRLHEACLLHFLKLASEVSRAEVPWRGTSAESSILLGELQHARRD